MSSDLELVERLRTDPAPAMHVSLDAVIEEGRRRARHRTARWATAGSAAAAAAGVALVVSLMPWATDGPTPPAATSTRGTPSSTATTPPRETSGSATIAAPGGSYAVSVAHGVLTMRVTRDGFTSEPSTAPLLPSGATWLSADGTQGFTVLVGVVPAGATVIDAVPAPGAPGHTISTARAGDFEAFVVHFEKAPNVELTASDITWKADGQTHAALGSAPFSASLTIPDVGTLRVGMTTNQLAGTTVNGTVDGARLTTLHLSGAGPSGAYAYGTRDLAGGRALLWGVLPYGTTSVRPHLDGLASTSQTVLAPTGDEAAYQAFAVVVSGKAAQISGFESTQRSGGGLGVIQ